VQKFFNWFAGAIFANIIILNKLDWAPTPIAVMFVCVLMFALGAVSLIKKEGLIAPVAWAFVLAPPCIGELAVLEVLHPSIPVVKIVCLFTLIVFARAWWIHEFKTLSTGTAHWT